MFSMRPVTKGDMSFWKSIDGHLPESEYAVKIADGRCFILRDGDRPIGVFRYNMFWDSIPFLTLILFVQEYRGKGFGTLAMAQWEADMRAMGHELAMTSTMVEETSQHFYRKLGYWDCGCLVKSMPPLVETMEMFMMKRL